MKIDAATSSVGTNPQDERETRGAHLFQPVILRFATLPSTNTEAAAQARRGAREGLVVVADEQTAGRGRHERGWASPAGAGLYASLVLRPRLDAERLPLVTFAAALAIKASLEKVANLETDIKWSNDVLARGRKLCGILAERIETRYGAAVVLGFGVNLRRAPLPADVSACATSVEEETGAVIDSDELLRSILVDLRDRYAELHLPAGAARLLADYSRASSYVEGKHVRVDTGTEVFGGETRGLASDGALRVELPDGTIKVIHAGDVRLVRAEER